jgi:hypothetical protein
VRTRDRYVNIGGSVREFLRRLNIDPGGKSMAQFRKQMLALSCCRMTLGMMTANGPAQVNAEPIEGFQAWHTDEDGQQTLWPGYIRLTEKFFESLMEHAVPLETEAIGRLQNSAFDLDAYSWLAHRLWRVNDPNGVLVSWAALKEQFGQEYSATKDFRRRFLGALKNATGAYKDARIEVAKGGLRLLPSPPPVKRKMVSLPPAAPPPPEPLPPPASGRLAMHDLVSERALEQVREIAPGWDKHHLASIYVEYVNSERCGERPRYRDAAFLGWVRKFTKSKRPA